MPFLLHTRASSISVCVTLKAWSRGRSCSRPRCFYCLPARWAQRHSRCQYALPGNSVGISCRPMIFIARDVSDDNGFCKPPVCGICGASSTSLRGRPCAGLSGGKSYPGEPGQLRPFDDFFVRDGGPSVAWHVAPQAPPARCLIAPHIDLHLGGMHTPTGTGISTSTDNPPPSSSLGWPMRHPCRFC